MKSMVGRRGGAVERVRLNRQLIDAVGVVLVDAPAGFGKTVLLHSVSRQTASFSIPGASDGDVGHDELTAALEDAEPESLHIFIDNAEAHTSLIERLLYEPAIRTLVLADRVIGGSLRDRLADYVSLEITGDDLRFQPSELSEYCTEVLGIADPDPFVHVLGPATEGWAAAIRCVGDVLARSDEPRLELATLAGHGPHFDRLADRYAEDIPTDLLEAFIDLGHLDAFTSSSVDALAGRGGVARARRAGLPVLLGVDGWLRLPTPVASAFRTRRPLSAESAEIIAPVLVASGGVLQGIRALLSVGLFSAAAQTVCQLPTMKLDNTDQEQLLGILRVLDREAANLPRLHLVRAQVHRNRAELAQHHASLQAALDASADDDPTAIDANLEICHSSAFGGASPELRARLNSISVNDNLTAIQRLRILEIDGIMLSQAETPTDVERAITVLEEVASQWEALGDTSRAAAALRAVTATSFMHLGFYSEGAAAIRRARELSWNRLLDRTLAVVMACRLDALSGRTSEFEASHAEAVSLTRAVGLPWLQGYLAWARMLHAGVQGDLPAAETALAEALESLGELTSRPTGAVLLCEAASVLAQAGAHDRAKAILDECAARDDTTPVELAMARLIVTARSGDLERTEALAAEMRADPAVPYGRSWRIALECSIAHELADSPSAPDMRIEALRLADERRLSAVAEQLLASFALVRPGRMIRLGPSIQVLGHFGATVNGRPIALPTGHPSTLLKVLILRGPSVSVDTIVDILWPTESLQDGRRRLKNVVSRLRSALGADAVERQRDTIALASTVSTDLAEYDELVRDALRGHDDPRREADQIVAALNLYGGDLLPGDLYEDWTHVRREGARTRALTIIERAIDLAAPHRPSATWLLDALLRTAPDDDQLLLAVARVAFEENHQVCARSALELAIAAAENLGISLDGELGDLRSLLRTR